MGPPSKFPVDEKNAVLQKYLVWQNVIREKAKKFIYTLPKGPFIGVHLRNGPDWVIIRQNNILFYILLKSLLFTGPCL